MHRTIAATITLSLACVAAQAHPSVFNACTGPDDPDPCLLTTAPPERAKLPTAGGAASFDGDRMVISWVGKADEVRISGQITGLVKPMPLVAEDVRQLVIQFPQAQQTRLRLVFSVKAEGKMQRPVLLEAAAPGAPAILPESAVAPEPIRFDGSKIEARAWLPPGYKQGKRYPIVYLADGGYTSAGSLLTDLIAQGKVPPVIVVGVDYAAADAEANESRKAAYLAPPGGESDAFLAHERFWVQTVIPAVEARYGAPPETRLRAIGGASNGGVWTASMALRHAELFGVAFAMSPGLRPALNPEGKPAARFYFTAGLLERGFLFNAGCVAAAIVQRGGVATLASYPSGHDQPMWARALVENVTDWLSTTPATPVLASAPPGCQPASSGH
ncbi:alpha/beta hydrolase [Oxalobacteraceae bacterium A2-2]